MDVIFSRQVLVLLLSLRKVPSIHILRQQKEWVGLENGQFLLTFSTVFIVGGTEKVQNYADVIRTVWPINVVPAEIIRRLVNPALEMIPRTISARTSLLGHTVYG